MPTRLIRAGARLLILFVAIVASLWLYRAFLARTLPDLEIWHTYTPAAEFRAKDYPDGISFGEYSILEEILFEELHATVFSNTGSGRRFNRYDEGSHAYAGDEGERWNRSFELNIEAPRGGVLFIHGASDSPYSTRALANLLNEKGMYVLSVRLPGNGTIPSGLRDARLDDWLAITKTGIEHVREIIGPDLPLYFAGYSVGGALALDYTLDAIDDQALEIPNRLFLYTPAVGVSPAARFTKWDLVLSKLPVFEKFGWLTVEPEFDPYKYNSFATNAGYITYLLTERIQRKMSALAKHDDLSVLPPIITFQSLVDSTVRAQSLVDDLYALIPSNGSEFVLFDMNRAHDIQPFIDDIGYGVISDLDNISNRSFTYTKVTNASPDSLSIVERTREAGTGSFQTTALDVAWPKSVYSLSHVALPFMPDDPWYGGGNSQILNLGTIAPRGETAALRVPIGRFMRLRYNPFFDYLAARTLSFCEACE